ncbi:MAG: hypothetical protein IJT97_02110 [Bacteroidaceae bacterium]|nr:hypothetical protein [Bacteroidaceae bacterium]
MKKILLALMAVVAIGFTSCNSTGKQTADDETAEVQKLADETTSVLSEIFSAEQLDASQINEFKKQMASINERIDELVQQNPELAKEYVAKIQDFLKENTEKIREKVNPGSPLMIALEHITSISPEQIIEASKQQQQQIQDAAAEQAENAANEAVDAANEAVDAAKEAAKKKAEEAKDAAKAKAAEEIDNAASNIKKNLGL